MLPNNKTYISGSLFSLFCIGGYLLAIGYGVTFLLPMLLAKSGGDEAIAGLVISSATCSTVLFVLFCGHLTDYIGSSLAVVLSSLLLAIACFGFAFSANSIILMLLFGFILGIGWGIFYTLGPIILTTIIDPQMRVQYFALLSGSMMAGIGTGPLFGRLSSLFALNLEWAFIAAGSASLLGTVLYLYIQYRLSKSYDFEIHSSKISMQSSRSVFRSNARFAIVIVGLGGCIFGGLSSFQSSYAQQYNYDYSLFFIGFVSAVITCRLLVARFVLTRDPLLMSAFLTAIVVISLLMFIFLTQSVFLYLLASITLGVGYGLTYSVINGLAANEAPSKYMAQSLLLFSLSYFVGVFGFPLIAGQLIVHSGVPLMLTVLLIISLLNHLICLYRLYTRAVENRGIAI